MFRYRKNFKKAARLEAKISFLEGLLVLERLVFFSYFFGYIWLIKNLRYMIKIIRLYKPTFCLSNCRTTNMHRQDVLIANVLAAFCYLIFTPLLMLEVHVMFWQMCINFNCLWLRLPILFIFMESTAWIFNVKRTLIFLCLFRLILRGCFLAPLQAGRPLVPPSLPNRLTLWCYR